ncbi:MAG: L-2-hydroxyglutarate oxidase [Rhodothermales bacterium]
MSQRSDVVVIGGGLVGLATALALSERHPGRSITVLEKEPAVGMHQSGRNSGVLHSGIYYKPGSLKARLCREGRRDLVAFCDAHGVAYDTCGKVIVAVDASEVDGLHAIAERGRENGIRNELIGPARLAALEPAATGVEAIHVPDAGIVDYPGVCRALAGRLTDAGHRIVTGVEVVAMDRSGGRTLVRAAVPGSGSGKGGAGDAPTLFEAGLVVACAGLHADRLARLSGLDPGMQIVPFRGVYYELTPAARTLCRNLIYPVPNPAYPFLGVHLTRMIDDRVEVGPNAVLATAREGYDLATWSVEDLREAVGFAGFRRLARAHWRTGLQEMARTVSKRQYLKAVRRLVPGVKAQDLLPCRSGIRAQALDKDGNMVEDFVILEADGMLHVCNAPSPAATACLAIGREIADRAHAQFS